MENLGNTRDVKAETFMVDGEDDLLNFSLDGEMDEDEEKNNSALKGSASFSSSNPLISHNEDFSGSSSFPGFVEEDLEWLSNKDAFPSVETCFDIFYENPDFGLLDQQSPVSVLENSSSSSNGNNSGSGSSVTGCCVSLLVPSGFPVRARSKRRSRRRTCFGELPIQQCLLWNQVNVKSNKQELVIPSLPPVTNSSSSLGRRCLHCGADKTPQWRAGPLGPKTLCNACGVRYKSGRLVPEYRPASSPTFSAKLHSNSHRKIIEMRRQKQMAEGGMTMNDAYGYRVG